MKLSLISAVLLLPLLASAPVEAGCEASLTRYELTSVPAAGEPLHVFKPTDGSPPRAIAVLVHGLNNKPEVMDPLAGLLSSAGLEVVRVGLTGHLGKDSDAMAAVTAERWKQDLARGYRVARERADALKVPLHFVGYSLGALVNSTLMTEGFRYDRQVLFAPAINLNSKVHLVRLAGIFGGSFCIGSRNDPGHRANNGTRVSAYRALFGLLSEFRERRYHGLNIPTLVFGDEEDELVDVEGLREDMEKFGLDQWHLQEIGERDVSELSYHHLVIDALSVGPRAWEGMIARVREHLDLRRP